MKTQVTAPRSRASKVGKPRFQTATGRKPVGLFELDRQGQEAVLSKLADWRVLRGGDVVFYIRDADEVALHLQEAKNDQFPRGKSGRIIRHRQPSTQCELFRRMLDRTLCISDPSAVVFQFQGERSPVKTFLICCVLRRLLKAILLIW